MENTYTFILDYLGGTYISQVKAQNNILAQKIWLENLIVDEIEGFTEQDKVNLVKSDFNDNEPTLLRGLTNAWHNMIETAEGYGYVNFVKTDIEP